MYSSTAASRDSYCSIRYVLPWNLPSASLAYFLLRASGKTVKEARERVISARPSTTLARAYRESSEEFLREERKHAEG
jgi:hypothetical protein